MYSLKEISTGLWLQNNESVFGAPKFSGNEAGDDTLERETEAELEDLRDSFNHAQAGRTGIFSSPRPH